jgi:hypothetical protein
MVKIKRPLKSGEKRANERRGSEEQVNSIINNYNHNHNY